jgi:hypothetical protein
MRNLAFVLALGALSGIARASTDSVTLRVSPATNAGPSSVTVTVRQQAIDVPIPPMAPASLKRDLIRSALVNAGHLVTDDGPLGSSLTILGLTRGDRVRFETRASGEVLDYVLHSTCGRSDVRFAAAGPFDPFDSSLQPAVFTAGIVTDVGELTEQVSAQDLSFQTDGPIICQALFQRLAPRAPQYGAQINYAGDRLEIYFDPAYTVTQGGIIFGTSSLTPGCSGGVESSRLKRTLDVRVSDSTQLFPTFLGLRFSGVGGQSGLDVPVPAQTPAPALGALLLDQLLDFGLPAFPDADPSVLRIVDLDPRTAVRVLDGGTSQSEVELSAPKVTGGGIHFTGPFQPFDSIGLPAIFTAGIVTDVGELKAQVSAQELSFQTDGPIICQALFQRLAPQAPQYGAQLNYAGDRLEVYFDPAYTVTQGGIIFGTTSPSPGASGNAYFFDEIKKR